MFHRLMTIAITLLACGMLSAADLKLPVKEAADKVANTPEEKSKATGIYAMLSPEVGGGQFVDGVRLGEIVYVSKNPMLTSSDIEQVRVRPKGDRFVIEIKLTKTARESINSFARLGKAEDKPGLGILQALVVVRDGKVEPTYFSVEDLVSNRFLQAGTCTSLADSKAFFDLFENTRKAK